LLPDGTAAVEATVSRHEPIVFGPVAEGEPTISGGTYPMPGYGWSCTCRASGFGYQSEADAEYWCERHMEAS
jgi:hypothetical protein